MVVRARRRAGKAPTGRKSKPTAPRTKKGRKGYRPDMKSIIQQKGSKHTRFKYATHSEGSGDSKKGSKHTRFKYATRSEGSGDSRTKKKKGRKGYTPNMKSIIQQKGTKYAKGPGQTSKA